MPIHHMLYRCPRCGHDPLDGHKRGARCSSCGTAFEQGRGSVIIVHPPDGPPEPTAASTLIADLEKVGGPGVGNDLNEEILFREARIALGEDEGHDIIRLRGEVLGFSERISWKGEWLVRLEGEALTFTPKQGPAPPARRFGQPGPTAAAEGFTCLLGEIRGVQISAKALQVTVEGSRLYQLKFVDDSPKRWEDLLRMALRRLYARSGAYITEFKPRIVTKPDPAGGNRARSDR